MWEEIRLAKDPGKVLANGPFGKKVTLYLIGKLGVIEVSE